MSHRELTEADYTGTRKPNFMEAWQVDGALLHASVDYELLKKHCDTQKGLTHIVTACTTRDQFNPLSKRIKKSGKRVQEYNYPQISNEAFREEYFRWSFAGGRGSKNRGTGLGGILLDDIEGYLLETKIIPYGRVFGRPSLPLVSLDETLAVEMGEVIHRWSNKEIAEVVYTCGIAFGGHTQQHSLVFGKRIDNRTGKLVRQPQERMGLHLSDIISYRLLQRKNQEILDALKQKNLEKVPKVNWPAEDGVYQVVQVGINGMPYLRFGRQQEHASILEELLTALEIPYSRMVCIKL
ncbi:MAG: hypothetical protein AB1668_05755 [Nanoarchaeota archaeon]